MGATNLNHVSVCARNLDESVRFYETVFGLERVPTPNFGFPVQWLRIGALQIHLFERQDGAPVYHHVALTVEDFESTYREVKALNILDSETFGHHLYELPGNNVQLYLRDPAGNLLEVDWPDARTLPADIMADARRLVDTHPQTEHNNQATLFLDRTLLPTT